MHDFLLSCITYRRLCLVQRSKSGGPVAVVGLNVHSRRKAQWRSLYTSRIKYVGRRRQDEQLDTLVGRRLNGFQGISLKDRTIIFLVILLDKTVSVG